MNAIPPSFTAGQGAAGARWAALTGASGVVAMLAGIDPRIDAAETCDIDGLIGRAEPWRQVQAENGIADLAAIMEPGIAALLAVNARGADPRPPAQALWREFRAARNAVLDLLTPSDACRSTP